MFRTVRATDGDSKRCPSMWIEAISGENGRRNRGDFISVRAQAFCFNQSFSVAAGIADFKYCTIMLNKDALAVAFHFHNEDKPNCFLVIPDGGGSTRALESGASKVGKSRITQCLKLIQSTDWIKRVAQEKRHILRRFVPQKTQGRLWVINLPPPFGDPVDRSSQLPGDISGVYRYADSTGKVVYIGRGPIRRRLQARERVNWCFSTLAWASVGTDRQLEWENFYLRRHMEQNNGNLPKYNRIKSCADVFV